MCRFGSVLLVVLPGLVRSQTCSWRDNELPCPRRRHLHRIQNIRRSSLFNIPRVSGYKSPLDGWYESLSIHDEFSSRYTPHSCPSNSFAIRAVLQSLCQSSCWYHLVNFREFHTATPPELNHRPELWIPGIFRQQHRLVLYILCRLSHCQKCSYWTERRPVVSAACANL